MSARHIILALGLLLPLGAAVCLPSGPLAAAAGPWVGSERAAARLIAAPTATGGEEELLLGLEIALAPGWKTYWRSPGDAGFPPRLDWQGSENLTAAEMAWPLPQRFSLFGLETFGYGERVVFPIAARLETPGAPLALLARLDYLVCAEICVPETAALTLDLPPGPAATSREAAILAEFQARLPSEGGASGLGLSRLGLVGAGEARELRFTLRSDRPLQSPDAILEAVPGYSFGKPEIRLAGDRLSADFALPVLESARAERPLLGSTARLTVYDGTRGLEQEVRLLALAEPGAASRLLPILALALLGGLILNLMPCVLPVLSLKLLSAVGHGGRARGQVRLAFLASAAGILLSFLLLAAAAIAVKSAGLAVGWGIQFQQPLFLLAMALIVTLFACNLFGFFEIVLPSRLAGSLAGGADHGGRQSLAGHFLTGVFATLLATPCSAPFLGTAVGFALAAGPLEILAVFAVLGLGLALPYLMVAAFPHLATHLPRPGPWMVTLRRALGLALALTAIWLLSVVAAQLGVLAALVAGALLAAVSLLLWLAARRDWQPARFALLPVAAALFLLVLLPGPAAVPSDTASAQAEGWRPLAPEAIAREVAQGRLVFVDVTAEWCITCQVNKSLVLERGSVAKRLSDPALTRMRGDWTRPDEAIARYLASFGRYGIPFNAVYGPGAAEGIALPELLTASAVLEALRRAAGTPRLAADK